MQYKEIKIKSGFRKITKKDHLFNGDYTIDPYQNCSFSCMYCDSAIDNTIYIKRNISDVLDIELKDIPRSNFIIGSVHDPYQKIEEKQKITRDILKKIKKHDHTCHVLTKSNLVLRDLVLLKEISDSTVTISIPIYEENLKRIFEKNVISADERFKVIEKLRENNIYSGIAIIPIIPLISEDEVKKIIINSKNIDSQYYLYRYLELKGIQKEIFLGVIKNTFRNLYNEFKSLYKDSILPDISYIRKMDKEIKTLFKNNNI